MVLIPEYVELLKEISSVCQRLSKTQMRVPKGAGGNYAVDQFIESLVMATRMSGGKLTVSRRGDQIWAGTLLKTLRLLEKYLPEKFFPVGELGRSGEHIRNKLADHIEFHLDQARSRKASRLRLGRRDS